MNHLRLTPVVKWLCIICFAAFIIQQTADQFLGMNLLGWFALVPASVVIDFRFWQLFTYPFLHGEVMHLFLNLMMLAFIGSELEAIWGKKLFLSFFFFCSVSGGLFYLLLQIVLSRPESLHMPMVGASAAIYGMLMAYGIYFGDRAMLFMMIFPMKAKHFVWILGGIELMSTLFSGRNGAASIAHLGGMIAGFGFLWGRTMMILAKKRHQEGGGFLPKKKKSSHLKLISGKASSSDDDDKPKPTTWH